MKKPVQIKPKHSLLLAALPLSLLGARSFAQTAPVPPGAPNNGAPLAVPPGVPNNGNTAPVPAVRPTPTPTPPMDATAAAGGYPFQNPDMAMEARIDNILSLMTLQEKVECLDTDPSVPRLGIRGTNHVEGLHGLAVGGPANWNSRNLPHIPTTTFPQSYGLGQTWDVDAIKLAGAIEGKEMRHIVQSDQY